jgi:hypothetical protein
LSGLMASIVMVILLRRRRRLGVDWLYMMGRIVLATLVMAIFLFTLTNFSTGLRHNVPAAFWLVGLVIFGGATFFGSAVFFGAIPAGLVSRWRH